MVKKPINLGNWYFTAITNVWPNGWPPKGSFLKKRTKNAKGVSINSIAKKAGVSPRTLTDIIIGKTENPDGPTLAKIAIALGRSPHYLLPQAEPVAKENSELRAHIEQHSDELAHNAVTIRVLEHSKKYLDKSIPDTEFFPVPAQAITKKNEPFSHASPPIALSPEQYALLAGDNTDVFLVRATDDAMAPVIREGDYVAVSPRDTLFQGKVMLVFDGAFPVVRRIGKITVANVTLDTDSGEGVIRRRREITSIGVVLWRCGLVF